MSNTRYMGTKLVFMNGSLLRENVDYVWRDNRLKFKNTKLTPDDQISVVYVEGTRYDYGGEARNLYHKVDPSQEFRED